MTHVEREPLIREILNRDRPWSLYALGDLAPAERIHCEWRFSVADPTAVTLFYRAFDPPVFFATGPRSAIRSLLDRDPLPPKLYLHIKPEVLDSVSERYRRVTSKLMQRMVLHEAMLADFTGAENIETKDLTDLAELYHCRSRQENEGTFFLPTQVLEGVYFGVRCDGRLVAAAGTHLINREESVAALGNVFCLPQHRGKGLGARVISAVLNALIQEGIRTIGLNVSPENSAVQLYRRLGFREACLYVEGTASV